MPREPAQPFGQVALTARAFTSMATVFPFQRWV
jgi:hypothetical protein